MNNPSGCRSGVNQRLERRGHTLIEVVIALIVGVTLLMSASAIAISTMRSMRGAEVREGVSRQARFVGMSLERDLAFTGVELESTAAHGALSVRNDTIVILSVPTAGTPARPYTISTPVGTSRPMPAGGTCAANCVDFIRPAGEDVELEQGDLAVLTTSSARRLVVIESVTQSADEAEVRFSNVGRTEIMHHAANFSDGYRLDPTMTTIQKVDMVAWWLDGETLIRAERVDDQGNAIGHVAATGVDSFDAKLIFTDGAEADEADPADPDRAFDRLAGVRIALQLRSRVAPPGQENPVSRKHEWRFTPRNLIYERNRRY